MEVSSPVSAADGRSTRRAEGASSGARVPKWVGKRVGRFRLISLLGKGAFGRVFLAEDVDLQRRVALKILTADATAKSLRQEAKAAGESVETTRLNVAVNESVDRMIKEARAAARLEHPGVVQIFEIGRLEGRGLGGYIAMELLEGGTLQELVRAGGPMDIARACTLVADAAEALQYAHDLGVIHRDVKPANLMLSRAGRCKVADFGLACIDDPTHGERNVGVGGTAAYMAPEIIRGSGPDPRSDQYALAATLYALLAGRPPFRRETKRQILEAHLTSPPPDLRTIRSDIDDALWSAIHRAMSKDPARRFASIRQFGQALRLFTVSSLQQAEASDIFVASLAQVLAPPLPPTPARGLPASQVPPKPALALWGKGPAAGGFSKSLAAFGWRRKRLRDWRLVVGGVGAVLLLLAFALWTSRTFDGKADEQTLISPLDPSQGDDAPASSVAAASIPAATTDDDAVTGGAPAK